MLKFLVVLAVAVTPFAASFSINANNQNVTVSPDQFTVYNKAGQTGTSGIFFVKKNGGSDNGKIYAMKVQKISMTSSNYLESATLAAARDSPWVTKIHYSFIRGNRLFIVMDLGVGGDVDSFLRSKSPIMSIEKPDAATGKRIMAELLTAVTSVHTFNVIHRDLQRVNMVIDSEGHLLLTDFGISRWFTNEKYAKEDSRGMVLFSKPNIFPKPMLDENQKDFIKSLKNMTNAQMPELKNHPYFEGVDWEKVAEKKSTPPFEPKKNYGSQLNMDNPQELSVVFAEFINDEVDPAVAARFPNVPYVAPEHRN